MIRSVGAIPIRRYADGGGVGPLGPFSPSVVLPYEGDFLTYGAGPEHDWFGAAPVAPPVDPADVIAPPVPASSIAQLGGVDPYMLQGGGSGNEDIDAIERALERNRPESSSSSAPTGPVTPSGNPVSTIENMDAPALAVDPRMEAAAEKMVGDPKGGKIGGWAGVATGAPIGSLVGNAVGNVYDMASLNKELAQTAGAKPLGALDVLSGILNDLTFGFLGKDVRDTAVENTATRLSEIGRPTAYSIDDKIGRSSPGLSMSFDPRGMSSEAGGDVGTPSSGGFSPPTPDQVSSITAMAEAFENNAGGGGFDDGWDGRGTENDPGLFKEGGEVSSVGEMPTGGQEDNIPALLSEDEYVIPTDVVASLGDGVTDVGHQKLDQMVKAIRAHKMSKGTELPPPAKGIGAYFKTPSQNLQAMMGVE